MKSPVAFLSIISLFIFCAEAQTTSTVKKETDRELRELVGRVHYVRIEKELAETTDGNDYGDGWIPSLTIYNQDGFVQEFFAYDDKGHLEYKSVSEFDSSGNKMLEADYDADGNLLRKTVITYDVGGNIDEIKNYHNADGSLSAWIRYSYDGEGDMSSHSCFNKEGQVISVTKYLYNQARKEKEEITYDAQGKLTERAVYSFNENSEEMMVFDNQGVLERHYVSLSDEKGDRTELEYDQDGKLTFKESHTYERDAQGNWIKEVTSEWEDKGGILVFKRTKITRRTITYYERKPNDSLNPTPR